MSSGSPYPSAPPPPSSYESQPFPPPYTQQPPYQTHPNQWGHSNLNPTPNPYSTATPYSTPNPNPKSNPNLYSYPNPNPNQGYCMPPSSDPCGGPYRPPPAPYGYPDNNAYGAGGQYYQQASAASLFAPGTDPDIIRAFQMADRDCSGLLDEHELQTALFGQKFSLRTVRLMIHLYGNKGSLKTGPKEFAALWKQLKEFKIVFQKFDMDRSETIDHREMMEALLSIGYAVSPNILQCLLQKYDRTGQGKSMDYDSFVECGFIVKGLTDKFKEKDVNYSGSATISYEQFMLMVLPLIAA